MTRTGWRLVMENHAATAFDGEGARLYGGRWNSIGVPMVYASSHQSLAALELRVHIDSTSMGMRYKCFSFEFEERLMTTIPAKALPRNWRQEPPPSVLQERGDEWVKSGASVILAVPSVIIPREFNYLVNPWHSDFKKLRFSKSFDFAFDQRLFQ